MTIRAVRRRRAKASLRPLVASDWTGTPSIGGAYSQALPGQADVRTNWPGRLPDACSSPEKQRRTDVSTAHV